MNKKGIIITILTSLITALLVGSISAYATSYLYNSSEVSYDNKASNITSDNVQGAIDELYTQATNYTDLNSRLNPVGTVIYSTTCDTMAKVVSTYGGTTWIQHSGYFLYGAKTSVTANNATKNAGEETHTLTVDEMPSHNHGSSVSGDYLLSNKNGVSRRVNYGSGAGQTYYGDTAINRNINGTSYTGGGKAHNNMPPYKNVYIWERTQ